MAAQRETVKIIEGVEVRFPYAPYDGQTLYMETVIKAVKNGKNALLESPTGTGKTLALVCSTLACLWHSRFKDETTFKLRETASAREAALLTTISDLRSSLGGHGKGGRGRGAPKMSIVYASRTHSQLKQVIREVKKSSYTNEFAAKGLTAVVLGSRDHLCVHAGRGDATGEALNTFCKRLVQSQGCLYYNGYKKNKNNNRIQFYDFMDIEELVLLGKSKRCCPFYASRDAHETADVTLLPYNYLLSPISRDAMDIQLDNAVLIIDEAHNVEAVAEEAASFALRQVDIARYLMALRRFMSAHKSALDDKSAASRVEGYPVDLSALFRVTMKLKKLDAFLNSIVLGEKPHGSGQGGFKVWDVSAIRRTHGVYLGQEILTFLMKHVDMSELRGLRIDETLRNSILLLSTGVADLSYPYMAHYESAKLIQEDIKAFTGLLIFFQHLFSKELLACPEYFVVFVTHDAKWDAEAAQPAVTGGGWKKKGIFKNKEQVEAGPPPKVMQFVCLQATPSFLRLKNEGVRSILLTSGTLSPLSDLEKSVGGNKLSFEYKLSNEHVVPPGNIYSRVITGTDSDPLVFSSDFNNRSNPLYTKALGESLLTFLRSVPGGVLVFFGSYAAMDVAVAAWKRTGIYARIEKEKVMFLEARGGSYTDTADDMHSAGPGSTEDRLREYKALIARGQGCVFIGVCRGKIGEGIDFSDDACRGVFICGVPYPNHLEDRVALKMDRFRRESGAANGEELAKQWKTSQAIRATNQAAGRTIRHVNDYGVIVLADRRYSDPGLRAWISGWVRRGLQVVDTMRACEQGVREFFRRFSSAPSGRDPAPVVSGLPRFFTSITEGVPPGAQRAGEERGDGLKFKSRKIASTEDSTIAVSLRAGSPVTTFANGFMTKPDAGVVQSYASGAASTATHVGAQGSAEQEAPARSGWEIVDEWADTDTLSLTKFRRLGG
ncbi:DNA repair helicase, putative [Babesia caballi]|uniref:DNA repair helicase, putative n=1 Tax=Babesia caballi TaxID=5871 RepID=A0AAV4LNW8_BABCB|nr:DNA repair helicase, putative [Babesia caballi]